MKGSKLMSFSLDFGEKTECIKRVSNQINKKKINNMKDTKELRVSFLILAHKNPSQLDTFVDTLDCEDVNFFIHIDKKSDIANQSTLEKLKNKKNVFFTEQRKKISWGGYGMIEATLELLKECLKKDKCDYISLHSGQDLPIKNKYKILSFLKRNRGKEYVSFFNIPNKGWWPPNSLDRIQYYWFIDEIGLKKSWDLCEVQKKLNDKRKYFYDIHPYAGWQWWTITRECAQYIIDYVNKNKSFCDYYKYTLIPDEGFFQTIILNSSFKYNVINNNLRYFTGNVGDLHPKILTKEDYNNLMISGHLFARKFDNTVDNEIIQMITNKIM